MSYPTPKPLSANHKKIAKFDAVAVSSEDDAWQLKDAGNNSTYTDSTLTLDSTYAVNGSGGIRLDWDHNATTNEYVPSVRLHMSEPLNLAGAKTLGFLVYIEGSDETTEMGWWDFNNVQLYLGSGTSWPNNTTRYYGSRGQADSTVSYCKLGYWWVTVSLDSFVSQDGPAKGGTFSWSNVDNIQFVLQADSATSYGTSTIHFLDVVVDAIPNRVPRIAICFDDGIDSDYTEAYTYMQPKGVAGTSFTIYDKVNNPADQGRISLDQALEMDASGLWEIAYHFTSNGGAFLNLTDATPAERATAHAGWQDFCTTHNLEKGRRSFAYPESKNSQAIRQELYDSGIYYARAGLSSNVNGITESGLSQNPVNPNGGFGMEDPLRVPAMLYNPDSANEKADRNYLAQGIYHARSTQGTHTGADSSTVLTDSQAQFWSTNEYQGFIIENVTDGSTAIISAGNGTTQTCTLIGGSDNTWQTGDKYRMRYPDTGSERLESQADLILKRMIETNSDAVIAYHGIVPSGATGIEVDRADFRYFIDKIAALNNAGVIESVTFADLMADTPVDSTPTPSTVGGVTQEFLNSTNIPEGKDWGTKRYQNDGDIIPNYIHTDFPNR